ncbi:hypothetical protein [Acrocarpospora sp. B8E8]|uniref:hypothetical protein n=1 Tax=Acrocarpospora sp. B8E8 TaxID=3153572 RepID=UPI00325D2090
MAKPTPAQHAVLLRIRDEVVRHNPLSPRRSKIPAATALFNAGWIDVFVMRGGKIGERRAWVIELKESDYR